MYKRNKNNFWFFRAPQGLILALTYLHLQYRESGLRSSLMKKKNYSENYLENDLIFSL